MSRLQAKTYYQSLADSLKALESKVSEMDLESTEAAALMNSLNKIQMLADLQIEALSHDDPRHPGL